MLDVPGDTFREHACWMSPGVHSESMHVGCLEAESGSFGSFWDGGQHPELRAGQYCAGDTRLIMDPFNPTRFQSISAEMGRGGAPAGHPLGNSGRSTGRVSGVGSW
jgi:hypothetical protein